MKTIQVEDDIYNHLLQNVTSIGEDASSILRRLLRIGSDGHTSRGHRSKHQGPSVNGDGPSSVDECIQHHRFQTEREAVGKFLFALSWLAQKHGEEFKKVLDIQGRKRRYFADSRDAIEDSGSSVMPQEIPNSGFWVATNNDTPKKKRMLRDVLQVLGYSAGDCNRLTDSLGD